MKSIRQSWFGIPSNLQHLRRRKRSSQPTVNITKTCIFLPQIIDSPKNLPFA